MSEHPGKALVAFIAARLDEDERMAYAAAPGPWSYGTVDSVAGGSLYDPSVMIGAVHWDNRGERPEPIRRFRSVEQADATGAHIARHDPARVLRGVATDRALLEQQRYWIDHLDEVKTDAELHAARRHPEWEYTTTECQRKVYPRDDMRPYREDSIEIDTSWEPNVEAGRDGWERFDYTEEFYWRRRRTPTPEPPRYYIPDAVKILATKWSDHPDYRPEWAPKTESTEVAG